MTYIIGHTSPDLDSIAAAISLSELRKEIHPDNTFIPVRAGEVNKETQYTLEKFGFDTPELLKDASDQRLILVDHNEFSQAVKGVENAHIVEVVDHHKVNFKYESPIAFRCFPLGASCTILAQEYFARNVELSQELAGLMLAAILVDTVITKSPTCTEKDKEVIEKLAGKASIEDWQQFGMELFKVRSSVQDAAPADIIQGDFKDFETSLGKVGIGQVETVDLKEFQDRKQELVQELENIRNSGGYHTTVLFITDIIKEGSEFLVATADQAKVEEALGASLTESTVYLDGVISRKKQVAPNFTSVFNNE